MMRTRLFIRSNELSNNMIALGKVTSVRHAVRIIKKEYPNLGKISIRRGVFYSETYKQIMVEAELAALDTLGMIVVETI